MDSHSYAANLKIKVLYATTIDMVRSILMKRA